MDADKKINLPELVLSATTQDFKDFLKSFEKDGKDLQCSCCGGSHWEINSNPNDKEKPVIITLPLPMISGSGVWAFFVICSTCGEIKLFNTNKVATWLHARKK
ncbi:hypothetical protein [Pantoea sp. UYEF8]|uniref:hypothetical protein n=1 Tax=Pantoea sp. UYEF8 TaxID=1756394 RepID=UPI0033968B5F